MEKETEKINQIKETLYNLKTVSDDLKLKSNIILKKQSTTDFSKFFSIFRMHILLIVKLDSNCPEILIECKTVDKTRIFKKEEFDLKNNVNHVRDRLKKKQLQ